MNQERTDQILEILGENPSQTCEQVNAELLRRKRLYPNTKGANSEIIVLYVLESVPKVLSVKPYHDFLGDLDGDLVCEIEGIMPVFIQVKTSRADGENFKGRIRRRFEKGIKHRILALSYETSFDDIVSEFCEQVNTLEGRLVLNPRKF